MEYLEYKFLLCDLMALGGTIMHFQKLDFGLDYHYIWKKSKYISVTFDISLADINLHLLVNEKKHKNS